MAAVFDVHDRSGLWIARRPKSGLSHTASRRRLYPQATPDRQSYDIEDEHSQWIDLATERSVITILLL